MQASRQNTRQLMALQRESMVWEGYATHEWSLVNYGPGTLWVSYTPEVDAAIGDEQSTRLAKGFSYTHSETVASPSGVLIELSLIAEAPLTYSLITNQKLGGKRADGIEEAPVDGHLYARRNAAWSRLAGPWQAFPFAAGWDPDSPLRFRLSSGLVGTVEISGIAYRTATMNAATYYQIGFLPVRPALPQFTVCLVGVTGTSSGGGRLGFETTGELGITPYVGGTNVAINEIFPLD